MKVQSLEANAAVSSDTTKDTVDAPSAIISYGGRLYRCSPEMARIFLKHAREVIERGDEQLVPLLHSGGIELLFVSRVTPYSLSEPE